MPREVKDVEVLNEYLQGVMGRADHHAGSVNGIALALVGAIIWRKDEEPLKVMERGGEMKNALWFTVTGKRYVLSYNHTTGMIDLRADTIRGALVSSFSNSTPVADIKEIFAKGSAGN